MAGLEIDLDATARAVRRHPRPGGRSREYAAATNDTNPPRRRRRRGARDVPGDPDLRRAVGRQRRGAEVGVPERTQRRARRARGAPAPSARAGRGAGDVLRAVRGAQHARRRTRRAAHGAVRRRRRARGRALVDDLLPRLRRAGRRRARATRPHVPRGGARPPRRLGDAARRRRHRHAATPRCRTTGRRTTSTSTPRGRPGVDYLFAHGLCTMAMCTQAAVGLVADGDPSRVRRVAVRFASPTRLDEDLTVDVYDASDASEPACTRSRRRARARPWSSTAASSCSADRYARHELVLVPVGVTGEAPTRRAAVHRIVLAATATLRTRWRW